MQGTQCNSKEMSLKCLCKHELSRSIDQCIYLICDGVAFGGIECCEPFTSNWFKKKPSPKTTCKLPPSHFMQANVIFAGHGIAIVVDFFSTKIRFRPKDPQVHHDLGWLIRDGWTSTIVSANHLAINVPGNFVGEPFKSWAAMPSIKPENSVAAITHLFLEEPISPIAKFFQRAIIGVCKKVTQLPEILVAKTPRLCRGCYQKKRTVQSVRITGNKIARVPLKSVKKQKKRYFGCHFICQHPSPDIKGFIFDSLGILCFDWIAICSEKP